MSSVGLGSTWAGSSLASDEYADNDGDSIVGRLVTKEDDFVTFDPLRYPVDMSALSSGGSGFECLKQDSQKADNAAESTFMWDHFFRNLSCKSCSSSWKMYLTTGRHNDFSFAGAY